MSECHSAHSPHFQDFSHTMLCLLSCQDFGKIFFQADLTKIIKIVKYLTTVAKVRNVSVEVLTAVEKVRNYSVELLHENPETKLLWGYQ